ncbi:MAG: adenylosuccinate lyase [Alphaproteobacteria bacterium]|jgi:adenylosuccinate lyase
MIPRYATEEMVLIWSEENKYKLWAEIEILACEALEQLNQVPKNTAKKIREKLKGVSFDAKKIEEIEKTTKHDVIAFLTHLNQFIGDEGRFLHLGMTSSDLLDTCLSLQLKQSVELILRDVDSLLASLKTRANETKNLVVMGRSHGIHAEPTTFGLKFARFYAEIDRSKQRLRGALEDISVCAISGAVGTYANINPFVEEFVAKKLGLRAETISTQIIPRDRHAFLFSVFGVLAGSIENIATEIRHLQRTEVLEAEEYFSKGQKGSSAMPHKRNPVLSENLCGLARLIRANTIPALENIALWHERDISHSSVERIIAPDTCILLDFALKRLTNLIKNLVIHPDKIEKNLNGLNGLIFSQRVLLALTSKGLSREKSYELVQKNAMKVWEDGANFLDELKKDKEVLAKISAKELAELFDIGYHTKNVEYIFKKVF